MKRPRLAAGILALALLPTAYVAWLGRDEPHFGQGHDDAIYYVTAKSIAQGGGYRIESLPEAPWQTKYPPLLPLYLSSVWRIDPRFPQNLPLATLFQWMWLPVWVALAYRQLRDTGLGLRVSLLLCAVTALNVQSMHFSMRTQPELMFASLWTASAVLVMSGRKTGGAAAAAGLLGGAAYLAKTSAIPLLAVAPLLYATRRQFRNAIWYAAAMAAPVAGWNWWARAHFTAQSDPLRMYYTDYLGYHLYTVRLAGYGRVIAKNLDALLGAMGGLLMDWSEAPGITERAVGVVILAGFFWHMRRTRRNAHHWFAAAYMAMLVVWHYPPDVRFLLPILPMLLAGFWTEMETAYRALRPRAVAWGLVAAVSCSVLWFAASGWDGLLQSFPWFREMQSRNYYPAYEWIRRNTDPGRTFLASEDATFYLFTGRKALSAVSPMGYFYRNDVAGVTAFVLSRPEIARREGLDYILDAPRDWRREFLPSELGLPQLSHRRLAADASVRLVWSGGESKIFEVAR